MGEAGDGGSERNRRKAGEGIAVISLCKVSRHISQTGFITTSGMRLAYKRNFKNGDSYRAHTKNI